MRSEAWTWFVRGLGFALAVAMIAGLASGVLAAGKGVVLVVISILLAAGLEPFVGWLQGWTGMGRSTTILVVYAAFFVLALGVAFLVVPVAINQFNELGTRLPPLVDDVRLWAMDLRPAAPGDSITAIVDTIGDALAPSGDGPDTSVLIEAGVTVADLLISIITVLTLVFFWFTGHQRLQRFGLAFLPAERRAGARETWNEVETRLGLWVRGQLRRSAPGGAAHGGGGRPAGTPPGAGLSGDAGVARRGREPQPDRAGRAGQEAARCPPFLRRTEVKARCNSLMPGGAAEWPLEAAIVVKVGLLGGREHSPGGGCSRFRGRHSSS